MVCASLDMWKGKTLLLSRRYSARERPIGFLTLRLNLCVSRLMSSSREVRHQHVPPRKRLNTIPIVMALDYDPVGTGFVASLARPGGNITGLSTLSPEISGKQLELLKEIVPRLSRVAVLGNSTIPGNAQSLKEMELVARAFGVQLQYLEVLGPKDIETAFRAASKGRAEAILALGSSVLNSQRTQIAELAVKNRLPACTARREFVEAGGL